MKQTTIIPVDVRKLRPSFPDNDESNAQSCIQNIQNDISRSFDARTSFLNVLLHSQVYDRFTSAIAPPFSQSNSISTGLLLMATTLTTGLLHIADVYAQDIQRRRGSVELQQLKPAHNFCKILQVLRDYHVGKIQCNSVVSREMRHKLTSVLGNHYTVEKLNWQMDYVRNSSIIQIYFSFLRKNLTGLRKPVELVWIRPWSLEA